jgi:hypothetical protein
MAQSSFPFENIDTTEAEFSQWAGNFQETGVQGSPAGTKLGITVTGSDLNLTIAAGQAFIRGHYYINTSDLVLAVTSAGVNTRIDIVVVELDPTANTIVTKIVSGEAVSADPVAPTLTQSATGIYQLPISTLTIPTSTVAITAGMLADTRTFMGNRIGIWTTDTRPANPTAYQTLGYNTTIGSHESWNGTGWVGFFDPITTEGDLVVGDATGQAVRLPVGENEQVLTVVEGAPTWAAGGGGGLNTSVKIIASNATYTVPTLASPIVRFTLVGGGGGGAGSVYLETAGNGGTTSVSDGSNTIEALGGRGGNRDGSVVYGFSSANFGRAARPQGYIPTGNGGAIVIDYMDLTGISTINLTVGAGGSGVSGGLSGTQGEIVMEYTV